MEVEVEGKGGRRGFPNFQLLSKLEECSCHEAWKGLLREKEMRRGEGELNPLLLVTLSWQLRMYSRELGMQIWTSDIYDAYFSLTERRLGNVG